MATLVRTGLTLPRSKPHDPMAVPRMLGDFVVGDQIGEGGFGAVYRAEQRSLDRQAVVKLIRRSLASDADVVERFTREARLASRFDHPYAAHVYAFGVEPDGTLWIAMELVRGTPLNELVLRGGPLSLERFVPLLERLCEVVQAAHDQGIVHRDIKPSNVMVIARSGRLFPKLLDFGIAKMMDDDKADRSAAAPSLENVRGFDDTHDASGGGLTLQGQLLGSPAYMAPEQWTNAGAAGPRTDQYALAVLAYEVLTGVRPFGGVCAADLLDAHRHARLPTHPALDARVHAVLSRATSKDPRDRFGNVDELAAALKPCRAEIDQRIEVPLGPWLESSPPPIAQAITSLTNAQTPARVIDRTTVVARTVAHWVGVLALACRSRLGPLETDIDLVRALRRRALSPDEWLRLAAELVAPFASRPEAWPVPEMVASDFAPITALLADPASLDDPRVERESAIARVQQLANVLRGFDWLLEYRLAVEAGDRLTAWGEDTPADARMMLVDGDGARIVALSPVVQIAPPAPGEPPAMFVLGGPGKNVQTARFVAAPRGYELDLDGVWSWLDHRVSATEVDHHRQHERPPYPGLAAFTADDHESFVGREREASDVVNRLVDAPMLVVVGPSGIGKSSFLAAGLAHAMPRSWTARAIRPGTDPIEALAGLVDGPPFRGVHPAEACEHLGARLIAAAETRGGTSVIVVDQAEELFTLCADASAREAFATILSEAARSSRIRVVLALRDDFLCRLDELATWRGALSRAVHILRIPDEDTLARMIAVPAQRRGYEFDDPSLPNEIARELVGRTGALPLLAFATAALWAVRDVHFRRLTREAYSRIGGVSGALVRFADEVVDRMPARDRKLVRLAFRRLIGPDGTRTAVERAELVAALGSVQVVERMLAARLIVSREGDAGDRVEVVHESLLATWPRLAAWRREDEISARVHAELAAATRRWRDRDRSPDLLWRGDALVELVRWRRDLALTAGEAAFADASERAARRRRRVVGGGVVALVAALASGLAVVSSARATAQNHFVASLEERGRLAIAADEPDVALLYLTEARRFGATTPADDLLISRASTTLESDTLLVGPQTGGTVQTTFDATTIATFNWTTGVTRAWSRETGAGGVELHDTQAATVASGRLLVIEKHGDVALVERDGATAWRQARAETGAFQRVAASPNGRLAASWSTGVHLWNLDDGSPRGTIAVDGGAVRVVFDTDGTRVAVLARSGELRIFDATTLASLATCSESHRGARVIRFSQDGATLVVGGANGALVTYDAATCGSARTLAGHVGDLTDVDLDPSGQLLATVSGDADARLWNLSTGHVRSLVSGSHTQVRAVRFSPDGKLLAVGALNGTVRIWDLAGTDIATFELGSPTFVLDWDHRGLVAAGIDGTVRRLDVEVARHGSTSHDHASAVTSVAFTPDARWRVTASGDRVVISGATTTTIGSLAGARVSLASDGRMLVALETSGRVTTWSVPAGEQIAAISEGATAAMVTPGGEVITGHADGTVRMWSGSGEPLARFDVGYVPGAFAVDRAGRFAIATLQENAETPTAVAVIDVLARAVVARLPGHVGDTAAIGSTRAVTCAGDHLQLWETGSWRPVARLDAQHDICLGLAFLPDDRLVASNQDRSTVVYDRDGHLVAALAANGATLPTLAISPDGSQIASGSRDGIVTVWDATSYQPLLVLPSHLGHAEVVAFTPDGNIASGGTDGRVVTWDLRRPSRSLAELDHLVHCRVPYRFDGDGVLPRALDLDDPSCH